MKTIQALKTCQRSNRWISANACGIMDVHLPSKEGYAGSNPAGHANPYGVTDSVRSYELLGHGSNPCRGAKVMKMYILVRGNAPKGWAVNSVAHASLECYLEYQNHPDMIKWLEESFKKVTCRVTDEELELAKTAGDYVIVTENVLDDMVMCLAFRPREEYPSFFKDFKLYS